MASLTGERPLRAMRRWRSGSPILAAVAVLWGLAAAPPTLAFAAAAPLAPLPADTPSLAPSLAGHTLPEALHLLQDRGWPVVFSSRLVRDSMHVEREPTGDSRRALLADLLRPHRLAVRDGAHERMVVVAAAPVPGGGGPVQHAATRLPDRAPRAVVPSSQEPAATVEEEIVVTPDRDVKRGSSIVLFARDAGDAPAPPQLGEDALSAVAVLPGASSTEGSSQLNVRGGGGDDVLVLLDGLELVRPYHLGDFDSAVSFVTPSAVERAELFTGGYPAQYGDRMSGVVDLVTRTPTERRHYSLGLGVLDADAAVSGRLGERMRFFVTGRAGSYQWPLELSGRDEHPRYGDTFGKLEVELGPRQTLLVDGLIASDRFELSSQHRVDGSAYTSTWDSGYAWMRHTAVYGHDLYAETVIGTGDVDHVRSGRSMAPINPFAARDRRSLESVSARQDWHWEAAHLGALEWGFDYERSNTMLDFWRDRDPADAQAGLPSSFGLMGEAGEVGGANLASPFAATGVLDRFGATNVAAYASAQIHPARRLSLELGARHDTLTLSNETHVSPRLAAVWEVARKSVLRASWGWFYQSQRPYELQLEEGDADGIAGIGSERAEHQDLSFERELGRGMMLSVAAYRRRLDAPRVRFENLFDPVEMFPELGGDRVRIAPDGGSSEGVELTVRQARRGRVGWWATWTESSVVDVIDGERVPRSTDQPHSLRAGLSLRAGRSWDLDLLWQYHTGWPTTALGVERAGEEGSVRWIPVLGPRNGERLPDYHRLDLRVGRSWTLGIGRLEAHLDLLDVYDRENLRGFENIRLVPDAAGGVAVSRQPLTWTGFVPSAGVRWTF